MAKCNTKTISKISKQQKHVKEGNFKEKIKKELLSSLELKKKKQNLKLNSVDFEQHFTKNLKHYRNRKPKMVLEKMAGSI